MALLNPVSFFSFLALLKYILRSWTGNS